MKKEPGYEISIGRRDIEDIDGITILQDLKWNSDISKWILKVNIHVKEIPEVSELSNSMWYILLDDIYPKGAIKLYPATDGGISSTYPHQAFNFYIKGSAWRSGSLCLDTQFKFINNNINESEPDSAEDRLAWFCKRAVNWIICAYNNKLLDIGDYFELPVFPSISNINVAFNESTNTFDRWNYSKNTFGYIKFFRIVTSSLNLIVKDMKTFEGNVRREVKWGNISDNRDTEIGAWIYFKELPIIRDWKVPTTFGELKEVCAKQGIDFKNIMRSIACKFRDGKAHMLLLGFPIPNKVGSNNIQVQWQAIELPVFTYKNSPFKGFMNKKLSYWINDWLNVINNSREIKWASTSNWDGETLLSRGRLDESLRKSNTVIIGCGAIGANVAEYLIRSGVHNITLIDGDEFKAGNLVRHTLSIDDIGKNKAQALTERLSACNPLAKIKYKDKFLLCSNMEEYNLNQYDLIIDCAANNELLDCLESYNFQTNKKIINISVSRGAKRLYLYSCLGENLNVKDFLNKFKPYIKEDKMDFKNQELPREGLGCWNPIFPAKIHEMVLMSSIAISYIEEVSKNMNLNKDFRVYECRYEDGVFLGVINVKMEK